MFSLYSIFKMVMLAIDFTHIIIVVLFNFTIVLMRPTCTFSASLYK